MKNPENHAFFDRFGVSIDWIRLDVPTQQCRAASRMQRTLTSKAHWSVELLSRQPRIGARPGKEGFASKNIWIHHMYINSVS